MRTPLLAALLALALVTPGHAAGPAPQITDPTGDWYVASQDVVSGRISSVLVGGKPAIRAELTLATAPDKNVPTEYLVQFTVGCAIYNVWSDINGARLENISCAYQPVTTTAPATVSFNGKTVTLQAPYALGLRRGLRVDGFAAVADTVAAGTLTTCTCDIAYGRRGVTYVLGSDLPRKS